MNKHIVDEITPEEEEEQARTGDTEGAEPLAKETEAPQISKDYEPTGGLIPDEY